MGTTARAIITNSYTDLGIVSPGLSLTAELAQQGLTRLNQMVSGWRTQFGTVTAVEKQIFPLTANKQTYFMGAGAEFNLPRPVTLNGAGLLLNGLAAAQSLTITRVGYVATVTLVSHPYAVGDALVIVGADQLDYNGTQTVESVPTANTFTFTVNGTPVTPATGTITGAKLDKNAVEIPRAILTDDAYQAIQIKGMNTATLFTDVYYNPTYPLGTIWLWPNPTTAANQLVLYLQSAFDGFADLNTLYDFPDLPGYAEALQYNLDLRLGFPNGIQVGNDIRLLASESLRLIKRANLKLTDLPNDIRIGRNWQAGYNINTGTGGGAAGTN